MGLDEDGITFLLTARSAGLDLTRTATLGRQSIYIQAPSLRNALGRRGIHLSEREVNDILSAGQGYAEPLLARLGASEVYSIDASPYEGATFVHDMNLPLPDALRNRFTTVID